jgi:16S rRNA processing protein RimM
MKEKNRFLEAGRIVNTHGVRGQVKIEPWCDSPDMILGLNRLYIDGAIIKIRSARVHGAFVLASLIGIDSLEDALMLKNKTVFLDRNDVTLDEGQYFVQDIIGLDAIDADSLEKLGVISDVLSRPGGNIYEISGERTILVPAVPEFVIETDTESGFIKIRLIEGM